MKRTMSSARRKKSSYNRLHLIGGLVVAGVLLLSTVLVISESQNTQDQRSRAQGFAALSNCDVPAADLAITADEQQMLNLVNQHRQKNGVGPLKFSPTLNRAAAWMSNDMKAKNYLGHTDSLNRSYSTRLANCGVPSGATGENVAQHTQGVETVFNMWKNSSAHNANMLNAKYKTIGIAQSGKYWTQDFNATDDSANMPTQAPAITTNPTTPDGATPAPTSTQEVTPTDSYVLTPSGVVPSSACLGACPTLDPSNPIPSDISNLVPSIDPSLGGGGGNDIWGLLMQLVNLLLGLLGGGGNLTQPTIPAIPNVPGGIPGISGIPDSIPGISGIPGISQP